MTTEHDYEPRAGENISTAAEKLCEMARDKGRSVTAEFNGVVVSANVATTPSDVLAFYSGEMQRRGDAADVKRRAWEATPEGREALRKTEERRVFVAAEVAKGVLPFAVSDQAAWDKTVAANTDGYGSCAIRYAARWANYMEAKLAAGAELAAIAKDASHEADLESITGFMYGCAVSILSQVWAHGEALRRWHNRDTQIGTEGDRANESGGVLNPAVLTVGE